MINIGNYFRFTENNLSHWKIEAVRQILDMLVHSIEDSIIDWEPGDEEWARLLVGKEVVAIVCAKVPLIIVLEKYKDKFSNHFFLKEIKIFIIKDFDDNLYCIEKELLEKTFGREMTSNISYSALSINDLWWATVT
ncbi:MAG: hypothetical protein J7524_23380 [Roseofilum sp. Belize BBD 4]|uniref:hypothetical protein n=1 Tax=Roseofilum sp. Belize BBD 4 TaxID=2821500 RepID=UPI000E8E0C14|nr:hypothetical protein [Roseofilum sp. Belize BBD 4]MBP0036066.1 hypothetical protein [Roseofilum sp. Belize BBD 4]HBQ98395.1 hypothetical protein [Cyanobacteria bacterium UBA11691]